MPSILGGWGAQRALGSRVRRSGQLGAEVGLRRSRGKIGDKDDTGRLVRAGGRALAGREEGRVCGPAPRGAPQGRSWAELSPRPSLWASGESPLHEKLPGTHVVFRRVHVLHGAQDGHRSSRQEGPGHWP